MMNKAKNTARNAQVAYSWGILLGMSAIPILALMLKVFPDLALLWQGLMALSVVLVARSFIGFLFPKSGTGPDKKSSSAATQPN
jgi:hypothetical protein